MPAGRAFRESSGLPAYLKTVLIICALENVFKYLLIFLLRDYQRQQDISFLKLAPDCPMTRSWFYFYQIIAQTITHSTQNSIVIDIQFLAWLGLKPLIDVPFTLLRD